MTQLTLYVGNKNYSSWSLRPWLALEACGIPFQDVVIPFDFPAGNPKFKDISPTGQVPVLHHGDVRVWQSLAIIEYAAELFPDAGLWPKDPAERAVARAYSMEMLSGFRALRGACPMNIRREKRAIALPDGVTEDVERIETIWREAVARLRRSVPVWQLYGGRCDVCAGGQSFRDLRPYPQSRLSGIYGCGQDASGLPQVAGGGASGNLDRAGGRGLRIFLGGHREKMPAGTGQMPVGHV